MQQSPPNFLPPVNPAVVPNNAGQNINKSQQPRRGLQIQRPVMSAISRKIIALQKPAIAQQNSAGEVKKKEDAKISNNGRRDNINKEESKVGAIEDEGSANKIESKIEVAEDNERKKTFESAKKAIEEARKKGYADSEIKHGFKEKGWSEEDIREVFW
jgi:hypothetical protein